MAAASSSPELFINCVGTFVTEGDLGVGAIVGSAVFNVLAVPACCALFAGRVRNSLLKGVPTPIFTKVCDNLPKLQIVMIVVFSYYVKELLLLSTVDREQVESCYTEFLRQLRNLKPKDRQTTLGYRILLTSMPRKIWILFQDSQVAQ